MNEQFVEGVDLLRETVEKFSDTRALLGSSLGNLSARLGELKLDKERLSVLKNELSSLEKALDECIYDEPRKVLEIQKARTLVALSNNAVYLDPQWLVDNGKIIGSSIVVKSEEKAPEAVLQPSISLARTVIQQRRTSFLTRLVALPFYEKVESMRHLSTEEDFIRQTADMCSELQRENAEAIAYAAKYTAYRQEMFLLAQRSEEALKQLQQELQTLNNEAEEEEDDEVASCIAKALALVPQIGEESDDEDEEDEEVRAVLRNAARLPLPQASGFSGQFISPEEKEGDPALKKRKTGGSNYPGRLLAHKKEKRENESVASSTRLNDDGGGGSVVKTTNQSPF